MAFESLSLQSVVVTATALGCGLIGGVFFAFSAFAMKALGRLPAAHGITAMQAINVAVLNPLFLIPFVGTAALCIASVVLTTSRPAFAAAFVGCHLYVVGTLIVTRTLNIPLNDRLARLDPAAPDAETVWRDYIRRWTKWNHVRTVAALLACAVLVFADKA